MASHDANHIAVAMVRDAIHDATKRGVALAQRQYRAEGVLLTVTAMFNATPGTVTVRYTAQPPGLPPLVSDMADFVQRIDRHVDAICKRA